MTTSIFLKSAKIVYQKKIILGRQNFIIAAQLQYIIEIKYFFSSYSNELNIHYNDICKSLEKVIYNHYIKKFPFTLLTTRTISLSEPI